ncbi:hypothetical protein B0H34DRAFT_796855 [Crassisporium funariophilum]|nr:hypothetical protein B0H34DRAFT_796855 [Crassisporium funariophilum]
MFSSQSGSRRWTHFHSALQLAIQRSAHKWTCVYPHFTILVPDDNSGISFEDFAECFPLYVEEDKNGSSATFNSISDYIEAQNFVSRFHQFAASGGSERLSQRDLDKLFKDYSVQENIDILHKVVNDAKDRKSKGGQGKDIWQDNLDPRVAVSARTVPVLNSEAARLKELIAQVEEENRLLQSDLRGKVTTTDNVNEHVLELLGKLDTVYEEWNKLPHEEIESWTVQTAESLKPTLRS